MSGRLDRMKNDVGQGMVKGLSAADQVRWTWPESGPEEFTEVEPIRLYVWDGPHRGSWLFAIHGKEAATGRWRTLYTSKYAGDGRWQPLAVEDSAPTDEVADGTGEADVARRESLGAVVP